MTKPAFVDVPYDGAAIDWPDALPFPSDVDEHRERHFKLETVPRCGGSLIVKIGALAIACPGERTNGLPLGNVVRIYGDRSMTECRESGYVHEGRVSVGGRKRSAFTSDLLVRHHGKLYKFAALHVRLRDQAERP